MGVGATPTEESTMRAATPEQVKEWQQAMLMAYRETGSVGESCQRVCIPPVRHKRWLRDDPVYAAAVASITETRTGLGLKSGRATGTGRPVDAGHRVSEQERFLEAFGQVGIVSLAATTIGWRSSKDHYRWMADDPAYVDRFVVIEAKVRSDGTTARHWKKRGPQTPEARLRGSEAAKARWDAKTPEEQAAHRAMLRKANARIKGGAWITGIEGKVMEALNLRDVTYQVHMPVGGYVADLYVRDLRLDIEVDGSAWHDASTATREAERDAALVADGITVLRLTEAEIEAGDWSRLHVALGVE